MNTVPPSTHPKEPVRPDASAHAYQSARSQQLIQDIHELTCHALRPSLQKVFDQVTGNLLNRITDDVRNRNDQHEHMKARDLMACGRQPVEQAFLQALRQHLEHIGEPRTQSPEDTPTHHLSLLHPAEQEIMATLDKIAARGVARAGPPLFELGYRMAALVGLPPLEGMDQPVGPHALACAFHEAVTPLGLPAEHNLLLLESFNRIVLRNITLLYEIINQHLIAKGILPELQPYAVPSALRQRPVSSHPGHGTDTDAPGMASTPGSARQRNSTGTPDSSLATLDELRTLLAQHHSRDAAGTRDPIASSQQLQTALQTAQQNLSTTHEYGNQELREQLPAWINNTRPGKSIHLSNAQHDTIELMAMIFEQLVQQVPQGSHARSVLRKLQLPILRMAISDPGFFDQREHPARRLLDTVTEVANDWLDTSGGDSDRKLEAKLEQVVDRACSESPSRDLYTELQADIEQHLTTLRRRAKVAERRHVQAMQGRERLNRMHRRAVELVTERMQRAQPRSLVRTLLNHTWADVLTLTLLQRDEEHPACQAQLAITDQLLGLAPVADRVQLQQKVEIGLTRIGLAPEEAVQATRYLTASDQAVSANEHPFTATALALRLSKRERLGNRSTRTATTKHSSGTTTASPQPDLATGPNETSIVQSLRKLPGGTWFEITDEKTQQWLQRKLAWHSSESGQILLVTRYGHRAREMSLDDLARRIACGQARQLPQTGQSLLDRAWRHLADKLHDNHFVRDGKDRGPSA